MLCRKPQRKQQCFDGTLSEGFTDTEFPGYWKLRSSSVKMSALIYLYATTPEQRAPMVVRLKILEVHSFLWTSPLLMHSCPCKRENPSRSAHGERYPSLLRQCGDRTGLRTRYGFFHREKRSRLRTWICEWMSLTTTWLQITWLMLLWLIVLPLTLVVAVIAAPIYAVLLCYRHYRPHHPTRQKCEDSLLVAIFAPIYCMKKMLDSEEVVCSWEAARCPDNRRSTVKERARSSTATRNPV